MRRKVGLVEVDSHCTLFDRKTHHESRIPGICFLRGSAVSIFVALYCDEEGDDDEATKTTKVDSLLVEQPRVPIDMVPVSSILELPAGMLDDEKETVAGIAVKEMEEECRIEVRPSDLVDFTLFYWVKPCCDSPFSWWV
jgi:8-oxo-dGTP pyrophosphatase MutT (NUDIX family)